MPDRPDAAPTLADRDIVISQLTGQWRWTAYYYGDRAAPTVVALVYSWQQLGCADVLLIHGDHLAVAYRAPISDGRTDPLRPEIVCWDHRETGPYPGMYTTLAVLSLPHPSKPLAPFGLYPAPEMCRVPDAAGEVAFTIRPGALIRDRSCMRR